MLRYETFQDKKKLTQTLKLGFYRVVYFGSSYTVLNRFGRKSRMKSCTRSYNIHIS